MPHSSRRSWTTFKPTGQTATGPATTGWPLSTPFSPTWRSTTPSTPLPSSVSSLSRQRGLSGTWSPTSPTSSGRTRQDVTLVGGPNVPTVGKGRKERRTPLLPETVVVLKAWLRERPGAPGDPLFPTTTARQLSREAIERRLARHLATAADTCPSLQAKHVSAHTLRHTAAMRLLLTGNDVTVIALWLGHEHIATTNIYLHADMSHKQQAIDRTKPLGTKPAATAPLTPSSPSWKPFDYAALLTSITADLQRFFTRLGITPVSA